MIHHSARVTSIRQKADAKLRRISDLEARVKDPGIREHLQRAKYNVEDVEHFFLSQLEREQRTSEQEARWLSYTVMALTLAELRLNEIEDAVAKFGSGVMSAGS
jgi:hypothetical protein